MESLVERAGATGALPTIQRLWRPVPVPTPPAELVHRGLNFVLASVALVLLLPVFLILALAVWLTSDGPVLYTQVRVGLDRRLPLNGSQNHRRERDIGGRP
ncbi:MAG TPA: sugar transferase, partial [Anaerolineales bacterium]